jgi:hypothetical protein
MREQLREPVLIKKKIQLLLDKKDLTNSLYGILEENSKIPYRRTLIKINRCKMETL